MSRSPSDRILDEWDSVTRDAPQPAVAPRRGMRSGGSLASLAPLLAAAIVVAAGLAWLGGREQGLGTDPTSSPSSLVGSTPTTAPPATSSPAPSSGCELAARIVSWDGAAGSRIATVELANAGAESCVVPALARPALVDGSGRGLAVGAAPGADVPAIELAPGRKLTTLVQVSNVCGEPPVAPVRITFDFGDGTGVDAAPPTPDDVTVPPCNGPSQPAAIEMHPWSRA